jgi:hypothetical protein
MPDETDVPDESASTASMSFARATAVDAGDSVGPNTTLRGRIHDGWDIAGNANGGYLLALTARAMTEAIGRPDPVSITAHYLSPGRPSEVSVEVSRIREGRRFSTASATLVGEKPILVTLGTFGELAESSAPVIHHVTPPDIPAYEECMGFTLIPSDAPPSFATKVNTVFHPDDTGFLRGEPADKARLRGWFRLPNDESIDTIALLCAVDAAPPPVFNLDVPTNWVPTLELTTHVRARPAPGPLRFEFTTRHVSGGFLEEDGLIWDTEDRLVAQSRQLALLPRD